MVHPVTPVGYEVILLRGGGKKKRRIGARNFTYLCVHDLDKYNCSECHGSRLCEVRPFVLATPVNHHHHDPAWRSLPTRPEAAKESATPGAINAYLQLTPPPPPRARALQHRKRRTRCKICEEGSYCKVPHYNFVHHSTPHCPTASPPHHLTTSPAHQPTSPPAHQPTSPPAHQPTTNHSPSFSHSCTGPRDFLLSIPFTARPASLSMLGLPVRPWYGRPDTAAR